MRNKQGMANTYGNLGIMYEKSEDMDRAEDYITKALNLFKELGAKREIAQAKEILARIRQARKK
jgi:Tfp pilus assembly protein PilF